MERSWNDGLFCVRTAGLGLVGGGEEPPGEMGLADDPC